MSALIRGLHVRVVFIHLYTQTGIVANNPSILEVSKAKAHFYHLTPRNVVVLSLGKHAPGVGGGGGALSETKPDRFSSLLSYPTGDESFSYNYKYDISCAPSLFCQSRLCACLICSNRYN